jgi:hypothetical protein
MTVEKRNPNLDQKLKIGRKVVIKRNKLAIIAVIKVYIQHRPLCFTLMAI